MNTFTCCHETLFLCCRFCYNWVQNLFLDDIKILKIMSLPPQFEWSLNGSFALGDDDDDKKRVAWFLVTNETVRTRRRRQNAVRQCPHALGAVPISRWRRCIIYFVDVVIAYYVLDCIAPTLSGLWISIRFDIFSQIDDPHHKAGAKH